jgi:mannose-6-phosphate isomerase
MKQLYPLKFLPVILEKMWGGSKLKDILHKPTQSEKAGESWEISSVEGNISLVSNGFLEGNNLNELIEVYMGDLVGDRIFGKFGLEFPLLIKFIDANDILSIQVHPDDELAKKRYNSFGKTEMWYIMQAEKNAELIVGFNRAIDKEIYLKHLQDRSLSEILNTVTVKQGDVFFLPAGRVHAIGAGILLAEIQQSSDITYRIYDFDRTDINGIHRELHTDLALDAIDFSYYKDFRTNYKETTNQLVTIVKSDFFTTNKLILTRTLERDMINLDCFVIYMCLEGSCRIIYNDIDKVDVSQGETTLIPASLAQYYIEPNTSVTLLEIYIDNETGENPKKNA